MKILFCTTTYETGSNGPTKFVHILKGKLIENTNVEFHILTEDAKNNSDLIHKVELGIGSKIFRSIGMIHRNIPYYFACRRLDQKHQFDVIWHNNAITGVLTAKLLAVPSIGMINDYLSATNYQKKISFSKSWIRYTCFAFFEQLACRWQIKIIANSVYLKNVLQNRYRVAAEKLAVLYKAVKNDQQSNSGWMMESIEDKLSEKASIKILFVKANYIVGGLKDLIEALAILPYTFEVNIVGASEASLSPFLSGIINAENVNYQFHGKLTNEEVLHLHSNVDLFCTPSVSEALGVANIEALIHGTPVVFRNVGGVNEVADNGRNGFVDNENTVSSLANAINECIVNDSLRLEKVKAGRDYALKVFSVSSMVEKFIDVSREAIR